jgi:PKD repeat protein
MRKIYLLLLLMCLGTQATFAQADCSSSIVVCGNTQPFNPSGVGTKLEQLACGGIEHNSVWIAFQAKASGKLNFVIRPFTPAGLPTAIDVDWSLYRLPGAPGVANCDNKTQLSCNFAGSATVFGIPGATGLATPPFTASQFNPGIDVTNGTWYALNIDQFSNTTPILLSVQFTGNPESSYLNSTPGIFDNRPDFTINTTNGCSGAYSFTNSSTAVGGIASYLWDFGDGSTSTLANPSKTYVTPGNYFVTLTAIDNNGCKSDIRKQVVFNNTPPTMNATGLFVTQACSDANNGTLTVTTTGSSTPGVSGGTPPYTYELVSPSPIIRPSQASPVFASLQPGTYTVKATDACGKSATAAATITQVVTNSTIGLGIQNTQSACNGTPSGTATIFANGSTPPYTMALVNSSPVTTGALPALQRDPVTATYYTTFTGLLPGLYTVEAIDACGKLRRATFTVSTSTAPIATSITSPSCAGTATGTITVTATGSNGLSGSGAPGTFQYALIAPSPVIRPFQNGSVFENLFPGTYTIATRDACGNIGTATATVGTAAAPNFGTSFTTASCPNGSTGTIEVQNGTTAGGGSPYTYALVAPSPVTRPVQNSNTFTGLPPGTYTVRMTDVCATSAITTVTVPASTAPTFTTAVTASCSTPASGTVTVTPGASALAPFTFELVSPGAAIRAPQGSNIANTFNSIFTALNQGSYTVRMTDACGTSVTGTAVIAAPAALTFPAGSTAIPSCSAGSTGQITVAQPANGLGAYRYELIAPSPVTRPAQYSRIFNGLPTGNYTIRITDSCGTQVDNSATPLALAAATVPGLSVTNTASCATNTGTITCLANTSNQGGGTYQFALIAPSPVTRPNQASPIFTGLPAGNYTVQITDQCGQTGSTTTTIAAAGAFTPAAGGSIVACNGSGYFAQIIVTNPQNFTSGGPIPPGSGGGPYTYAVYDATNTTLIAGPQAANIFPTITPVAGAPSHTIRVTDVCGNTSTTTVTLNPPAALTAATISAITASCAASNTGVIRVTTGSGGGLIPYRYTLIDATTLAVVAGPQTATTFEGVPDNATGYLVRTTDACGNVVTSAAALPFPAAVVPTATVTTIASCASPATGSITVTPGTGATLAGGTFSYALYDAANTTLVRPAQASPLFASLAPAAYTVRITDRCGSTGTAPATVASGVAAPTATGTATGTCTGGNTGSIQGASTGGSLPVTYTLVNQVTSAIVAGPQADSIFSGLATGTYIIRVIDACGTVTNSANIVLGNLTATPTISTTTALDCAGSAKIGAYGGAGSGGPYTYAICTGAGCTSFGSFTTASNFTVLTSGTYRVAVRDRCGLQTTSADIVINIPPKPVITGVTKANVCGTTTITVAATGLPNTPYYSVDGANFSPTLSSVTPGCHTVRVADNNAGVFGCASDAFEFSVFAPPVLSTPAPADINCNSGAVTIRANAGTGSAGCAAAGATLGVRLVSCTGCTGPGDAVGTTKAFPGTFYLTGATSAVFIPVVRIGGSEICTGSTLTVNFATTYCGGNPIPVTIEYFNGYKNGNEHKLVWKVSCTNTPRATMTLERSSDGRNFTGIYTITAEAARCLQPFDNTDASPLPGLNYYRLKTADADGKVTYSSIIALLNRTSGFAIVGIVPNPVSKQGNAVLNVTSAQKGMLQLMVTDMAGRNLIQQTRSIEAGSNQLLLNLSSLAAGSYQVTARNEDGNSTTIRFIKE